MKLMPRTKPQRDQAGVRRRRSAGTTSPAPTRPRPSCRRSSSSCATRALRASSAPRSRRASCCTARPAPARRCWPRPSPTSPARSSSRSRPPSFVEMFAGLGAARIRRLFDEARKHAPGDHLHRRDRRRRRRARLGQQLRARADAQPAAGRDGRLRLDRRPRRDRRLEPAREARPGAAAPGPLRPPDLRLAARRRRPRGDPARPHARQAARRDVDLAIDRAPDRRA